MTLVVVAFVLTLVLISLAVATAVRHDGYGSTPVPVSHHAWDYDALSSTPPASLRR